MFYDFNSYYNNPYMNYSGLDSGGSKLLYNNGSKLTPLNKTIVTPGYRAEVGEGGGGSPVPIIFPQPDPNWYYYGYPGTVKAGSADGGLVEYIPVSFYARKSGKLYFGFNQIDIYKGYLNSQGQFVETVGSNGTYYNQGDFVFAILLDKYAGAAQGSKVHNESYWNLLSEISNIQPGQTYTKSVAVTSGVTTQESKTFSSTVGSTVGFKAGFEGSEISASLSVSLTNSFSTSVSISTQITVTDTVNFQAQQKPQRAALYQFIEKYRIVPGGPIQGWRDYLNGTSTEEARWFSNQFVCSVEPPPEFPYQSRYFATSFVLEPDK
ncbi:hypothetical protein PV797_12285 [Clostridiaceae bacterium M8S5]|nr:hypothetical protein PV797_12285 [Clostridiaceae bacterium M8S5]